MMLLVGVGCDSGTGPTAKVKGTVNFNGKPVADGYIVFRPADGKGVDAGGAILDGSYSLSAVPVGQKVVVITSNAAPTENRPLSSEEASKLRINPKKQSEVIPPDAKGNGTKVEVKEGGEQSFDFQLRSP
ncbi:hypothetical protein [Tuwongella immobilis]|nr:hypothetical protein [Tuwongella immobilis]